MTSEEILKRLQDQFGEAILGTDDSSEDLTVKVAAGSLLEVSRFCRDDSELSFDLLSLVSGVDWTDRMESVMHLDSTAHKHHLVIKVDCDRESPRCPSVVEVWNAADWHERETYDMFGIIYEGHPNLVRILCAEDWEGYPLRKDYLMPDEYHGIPNDFQQAGKRPQKYNPRG